MIDVLQECVGLTALHTSVTLMLAELCNSIAMYCMSHDDTTAHLLQDCVDTQSHDYLRHVHAGAVA